MKRMFCAIYSTLRYKIKSIQQSWMNRFKFTTFNRMNAMTGEWFIPVRLAQPLNRTISVISLCLTTSVDSVPDLMWSASNDRPKRWTLISFADRNGHHTVWSMRSFAHDNHFNAAALCWSITIRMKKNEASKEGCKIHHPHRALLLLYWPFQSVLLAGWVFNLKCSESPREKERKQSQPIYYFCMCTDTLPTEALT